MSTSEKGKQQALCGTWASPLSAEDATGSSVGLGGLSADGADLYWLESRPSEKGRTALVHRAADGTIEDVTPPPVNVASRVHEYGGGSYAVQDGRIVYTEKTDGSVWLVEKGEAPRKIVGVEGARYADFRFVPGTGKIVAVREDHRNRKPTDPEAAIVLLDTEKGVAAEENEGKVIVKGPDFLASPRPSPDGKSIAWISWEHPDMPWDATCLHVAKLLADGVADEKVIAGADKPESVVQPEWSPEGVLHFSGDRTGWWNIYKLDEKGQAQAVTNVVDAEIGGPQWVFGLGYYGFKPDGSIVAELTKNGREQAVVIESGKPVDLGLPPVGQPPLVMPDGSLAYVASAPDAPHYIAIHPAKGGVDEVVRSSGPALLSPENISVGQEITFPTAHGEEAHGFYYPPVNESFRPQDGEKPPLVVMIHGGPTSAARAGFSPQKQYWTSRGFGVVDVNYRGSTGYGRPYRQKLDGNWGVVDVEDCIAAVEYLVKQGLADPERVVIRGGSAGGFTVLAALTSSEVFKAGASLYGVGDLMLLAEETHKFESRYLDRLLGPLPESEDLYKERSPINHLDKLKAGVIFFQGLDDKVVPPSQARVMVDAMRKRGQPVAHYEFEGEAHGFRKAETQKRVLELELAFYGKMFGFTAPGLSEEVKLEGQDKTASAKPPRKTAPGK